MDQAFAVQAGREIRVIVDPEEMTTAAILARDIVKEIDEADVSGPDQGHRPPRDAGRRVRQVERRRVEMRRSARIRRTMQGVMLRTRGGRMRAIGAGLSCCGADRGMRRGHGHRGNGDRVIAAATAPSAAPSAARASPSDAAAPTARPVYPAISAGPFEASLAEGLRTKVDVLYTDVVGCGGWGDCAVPLDILAPTDAAHLPTVVLLHGGPIRFEERRYLDALAAATARRGAVVFLASYRSGATGNPVTDSIEDVTCAVQYARSVTKQYGGDPARVVLVGHSYGSDLALSTAVSAETQTPDCLAQGDGRPEAAVGLSGFQPHAGRRLGTRAAHLHGRRCRRSGLR